MFLPERLTPARAYILGVAFADGSLSANGFRITSADDAWLRQLPRWGEFTAAIYRRSASRASDLVLNARALVPILQRYGFSAAKSISGVPANIPPSLYSHFMRGVFDGDGSVWSAKAQLRVYLCGNRYATGWYQQHALGMAGFFIAHRPWQPHRTIQGRPVRDNQVAVILQSRNTLAAATFLDWIYNAKGEAFLTRKFIIYEAWQRRSQAYHDVHCAACRHIFSRRSSTDKFCGACGVIRQRLHNRRADHRRRHQALASNDLNDYRLPYEQHLNFSTTRLEVPHADGA